MCFLVEFTLLLLKLDNQVAFETFLCSQWTLMEPMWIESFPDKKVISTIFGKEFWHRIAHFSMCCDECKLTL